MDQVGYYKHTMEENTVALDIYVTSHHWIVPLTEVDSYCTLVPLVYDVILVGHLLLKGCTCIATGCSMKLERVTKRNIEESDSIQGLTEREAHEELTSKDRERKIEN